MASSILTDEMSLAFSKPATQLSSSFKNGIIKKGSVYLLWIPPPPNKLRHLSTPTSAVLSKTELIIYIIKGEGLVGDGGGQFKGAHAGANIVVIPGGVLSN